MYISHTRLNTSSSITIGIYMGGVIGEGDMGAMRLGGVYEFYIYIYICMYVYIYIYMYIYVNTYEYI